MNDQGGIMNVFKSIGRLIANPLGAVVICVGGGVAWWYYAPQLAPDAFKEAPRVAQKVVSKTSPEVRSNPIAKPRAATPIAGGRDKTANSRNQTDKHGQKLAENEKAADQRDIWAEGMRDTDERPSKPTAVAVAKPAEAPPTSNERKGTSTPEGVLESRGLTKDGVYYVVATETEIGKQFRAIIPIFDLVEGKFNQFQAILEVEAIVQSLNDQRIIHATRIRDIQIELARIGGSKLPEDQVARADLNAELPNRNIALSDTIGALEIAKNRLVSPAAKQAVYDEFMLRRGEFLEATKQLSPTVKRAYAEYKELGNDYEVRQALRKLGDATNSPIQLGPSKALKTAIARLRRGEEMVAIDKSAYRRGTKAKAKAK
jgi:hypothetical protein